MQIPETPRSVEELDLMKRLDAYTRGQVSCNSDGTPLGPSAQQTCQVLYGNLVQLVNQMLVPLLDRVNAHEMETFTMHDHTHGLKVAHLMWNILEPNRQEYLTPPEIAMLVAAAFLHDVGMALAPDERAARLDSTSDLWDRFDIHEAQKEAIEKLRGQISDPNTPEIAKQRAIQKLTQAEEVMLSQDTRERHASAARYQEVLQKLDEFHQEDRTKIPDIESCLSLEGDSFRDKLIDICVSHNEDAEALVKRDDKNPSRPRFPGDYPIGRWTADLHMIAAALRLADILDFDRERTPAVLFHYLLPGSLDPLESRSVLEWGKHLTISNWRIEDDAIVYRGQCTSHILHHAVVLFCTAIAKEIEATRATFGALGEKTTWPFALPSVVKNDIHEIGYHYVPYQFELDDERVYQLLMGGAIYDNPLVAVRELVQNAVDACKLRDALTQLIEPEQPSKTNRILVRYEEPTDVCPQPRLIVTDTGTGMDALIQERYFLKVGRSYYGSSEFNQFRGELRRRNLDFAPVSEFGIGFLSCFLLADRIEVETAMWESVRGDTRKRILQIDGPTRLIRLDERPNEGVHRFKGTQITLFLTRGGSNKTVAPTWKEVKGYLEYVCQDLPYRLNLEYVSGGQEFEEYVDPTPSNVQIPAHLESAALHIPVKDQELGLEGDIVLLNYYVANRVETKLAKKTPISIVEEGHRYPGYSVRILPNALLRGGFRIGKVSGLPSRSYSGARLRLTWNARPNHRFLLPNLARNGLSGGNEFAYKVLRIWLTYLIDQRHDLPSELLYGLIIPTDTSLWKCTWLEKYDALTLYQFAKQAWQLQTGSPRNWRRRIDTWEQAKGKALPLGYGVSIDASIFRLVLPRITSLRMDSEGILYVNPPESGWQKVLEDWHDFISNSIDWQFAEYIGDIKRFLLFESSMTIGVFNSRFANRFSSFTQEEVVALNRLLRFGFLFDRDRPIELTRADAILLKHAKEVLGDLEICHDGDVNPIGDIELPESL